MPLAQVPEQQVMALPPLLATLRPSILSRVLDSSFQPVRHGSQGGCSKHAGVSWDARRLALSTPRNPENSGKRLRGENSGHKTFVAQKVHLPALRVMTLLSASP